MIEYVNISKSFEDRVIFDGFSLSVGEGLTVFTGGSGCGKSTLLRMTSGLCLPDSGEISVEGKISVSFQEPRLFPTLTALENVSVVSSVPRATELITKLGLSDSLHKHPYEMSGGMNMRVSVARAISRQADIYIFDEPTAALDKDSTVILCEVLKSELCGKTVLCATHSKILTEYADRVIELDKMR